MEALKKYLAHVGTRRLIGLVLGNLILGIGCGSFKWAAVGNDPFSASSMALAAFISIPYGYFNVLYNVLFFTFLIIWGRKYIGIGTIINWFCLGFTIQWTYAILCQFGTPVTWPQKILVMAVGVIVICFGLSLYQTSDTGLAPFDSISVMMHDYWHLPYFWCRIMTDSFCALVTFLTGGLLGVGTLVCAFGLGPIIQFFNTHCSEKVLRHKIGAA